MDPVTVCNIALQEIGQRVLINNFDDGTPAAQAAKLLYTPKMQMLMRSAPWNGFRKQAALTMLKATVINGTVSTTPPPQPWDYEYQWPSDCLKARFIIPTANALTSGTPLTTATDSALIYGSPPTTIPYVVANDLDANNNPIKVILTSLPQAQLIYTVDLSPYPDLWDPMFLSAATATLGAYFINALMRDRGDFTNQMALAKDMVMSARMASGNESISSIDHTPDWMAVRMQSAVPFAWNSSSANGAAPGAWDYCEFPGGLFF